MLHNPSTAPSPDAMAEMERLLCNCSARSLIDPGPHTPDCALNDFGTAVASALQRLMDENKGLRDALSFYADLENWRIDFDDPDADDEPVAELDGGAIARAALSAKEGK